MLASWGKVIAHINSYPKGKKFGIVQQTMNIGPLVPLKLGICCLKNNLAYVGVVEGPFYHNYATTPTQLFLDLQGPPSFQFGLYTSTDLAAWLSKVQIQLGNNLTSDSVTKCKLQSDL